MTLEKISILIPSYNEEQNLLDLLPEINKVMKNEKSKYDFEIIVINDGSLDNTEKKVNELKEKINNLILINLKQNMGKAFALDIGIKKCSGNIIASIDADNQYDANDFVKMIDKINDGYDFVNGKRLIRKDTFLNSFFSKVILKNYLFLMLV